MKHLSVSLLLCLLHGLAFAQAGQDVHFDLRVPYDTIGMNEQLQLQFTLANAEIEHIELPDIPGFEQAHQPSRSQSVSIINGQRSSKVVYTYFLRPTTKGTFYLPSVPVETSAGVFETMEMPITVVEHMPPRQAPLLSQSPFGSFGFPQSPNNLQGPKFNWEGRFDFEDFDKMFPNNFQDFPNFPNLNKDMEELWKELEKQMPKRQNPKSKEQKKQYRL